MRINMNLLNEIKNIKSFKELTDYLDTIGVKAKEYHKNGTTLVSLNYSMIDSPRFHEVSDECRGLILELTNNGFEVVSRSFDRFYNYEEHINVNTPELGKKVLKAFKQYPNHIKIYEKLDGSLIKLYHHNKLGWQFSTRSVPFAEQCNIESIEGDLTFQDLIDRFDFDTNNIHENYEHLTFILELCCKENKVVTNYNEERLVLLAIRNNETGDYLYANEVNRIADEINLEVPETIAWTNFDDLMKAVKELPDLQEGFILVNERTQDRIKIKSPIYVHAHHLRTNGHMTVKKAFNSYNEKEEILAYFPELGKWYDLIDIALVSFKMNVLEIVQDFQRDTIKDFVIELNKQGIKEPLRGAAIQLFKGQDTQESWNRLFDCKKIEYIEMLKEKLWS